MAEEVMNFEQVVSLQVTVDQDSIKKFLSDLTGLNDEAVKRMSGGSKGVSDSLKELIEERAKMLEVASEKNSALMEKMAGVELSRVDELMKGMAARTQTIADIMQAGGEGASRLGLSDVAAYRAGNSEIELLAKERKKMTDEVMRPSRERAEAKELRNFQREEAAATGLGRFAGAFAAGGIATSLASHGAGGGAGVAGAATGALANVGLAAAGDPTAVVGLLGNIKDIALASYDLDRTRAADQLKGSGGGLQFDRAAASFSVFEMAKRNQTATQYSGQYTEQEKGEIPSILKMLQRGAGIDTANMKSVESAMDGVKVSADYLGISLTEAADAGLEYSRVAHMTVEQGLSAIQEAQFTINKIAEANKETGAFDTAKMTKILLDLQKNMLTTGSSAEIATVFVDKFSKQLNDGTMTISQAMAALEGGKKAPLEGAAFTAQRIRAVGGEDFKDLIEFLRDMGGGALEQGRAFQFAGGGAKSAGMFHAVNPNMTEDKMERIAEQQRRASGRVAEDIAGGIGGANDSPAQLMKIMYLQEQLLKAQGGNVPDLTFDAQLKALKQGATPMSPEDVLSTGKTAAETGILAKSAEKERADASKKFRDDVVGPLQQIRDSIVRGDYVGKTLDVLEFLDNPIGSLAGDEKEKSKSLSPSVGGQSPPQSFLEGLFFKPPVDQPPAVPAGQVGHTAMSFSVVVHANEEAGKRIAEKAPAALSEIAKEAVAFANQKSAGNGMSPGANTRTA